jgi:hypothetical protein
LKLRLFQQSTTQRDFASDQHSDPNGLAMSKAPITRDQFQGMPDGMAKIENPSGSAVGSLKVLAFISGNDLGFESALSGD